MPEGDDLLPGGPELSVEAPVTKTRSRLDVAGASFQLSWKQAETSSLFQAYNRFTAAKESDVEDHNELNQEYRLPIPLNKPMSRSKFDVLVEEDLDRKKLQQTISEGKDDILGTAITFGSGLTAQAVDPVAIGLGVATGSIFTRMAVGGFVGLKAQKAAKASIAARNSLNVAKKAAKLSKTPATLAALKAAELSVKETAPGILRTIGEGVAGNVIGEAGIVVPSQIGSQQNIDVADSVWNAVGGGVAFPLAIKALKMPFSAASKLYNLTTERVNAGKVPFGDARELELTTGQIRSDLDAQIEGLKREEVIDVKKIEALESLREDLEQKVSNTDDIRKSANTPDQDIYHDKAAEKQYNTFKEQKKKAPITEEAQQQADIEATSREYDDQIAAADEATAAQLIEAKEAFESKKTSLPDAFAKALDCIKKGGS